MKYYAGVDIGGTNTKIGILDNHFNILAEQSIPTLSQQGARSTFSRIWQTILDLLAQHQLSEARLEGIGLGIPGPVVNQAIVKIAANFSWGNDFNAKQLMEEISHKNVVVENDVRAITLGEHLFGAGQGVANLIVVPIGTGIASGILLNGKVLSGSGGCAGEFGHIMVNEQGMKCGCGLTGCLETYTSAPGLVREAKKLLSTPETDKQKCGEFFQRFSTDLDSLQAHHIFEYAKKGDHLALQVVDSFTKYLAYGLGVLINIFNPELIVLAGGVAKSADFIIEKIQKFLPHYSLGVSLQNLQIKPSQLLDSAGVKGAAALVIKEKAR
ncbi:ROK family protein [Avibacterium paragallinarum]|nr:ROK family protein [Avibacterium paragallinarum]AZI13378.1 ROK family protein [Avibacterium paragallinarum]QIR12842.1 ROK family protein [Avibacterium paragallinarum]QJE10800.1 ROK family protein [Avibacterium paragallinarum]QJE12993.1 ROK family protein [Avibacterium paragallinarum]QJE15409.1 ROK family protein [Avibacterium paragallinarum]